MYKHPIQSKTIQGSITQLLLSLAAIAAVWFGVEIPEEQIVAIVGGVFAVISAVQTIYGRFKATQPLSFTQSDELLDVVDKIWNTKNL